MNFNTITDVGAVAIAKAVSEAKSPKQVDLRLSQNEIRDESALEILNMIDKMLPSVDK